MKKRRVRGIIKERREKDLKNKKNFLPSLVLIFTLWLILLLFVFNVNPDIKGAVPVFFLLLTFGLLFSLSFLLTNTRRGIISTLAIIIYLTLSYFGVGNILNLSLIAGVAIAFEIYFSNTS